MAGREATKLVLRALVGTTLVLSVVTLSAQLPSSDRPGPKWQGAPSATGWTHDGRLAPQITTHGAATRVVADDPVHLFREHWRVEGPYRVTVRVMRSTATALGSYGVVVGGRGVAPLTCAIRTDGAVAVHRGAADTPLVWKVLTGPDSLRPSPSGDEIAVQVADGRTTCAVNGRVVATVSSGAGELDGAPGVYVGAGADVRVSGFTIETASQGFPGGDGRF